MKRMMRERTLRALRRMDERTYIERSDAIIENVVASSLLRGVDSVGLTIGRFPEVETKRWIERLWQEGMTVAVPKCETSDRSMDFRVIESWDDVEVVYLDLEEPIVERTVSIEKEAIDVLIVPGVVYDEQGYRIGFGGGYYDRYLTDFSNETISLAFEEQIVDEVPKEQHDVPVDWIVSDVCVRKVNRR